MKKALMYLLSFVLLVSLTACGGGSTSTAEKESAVETPSETTAKESEILDEKEEKEVVEGTSLVAIIDAIADDEEDTIEKLKMKWKEVSSSIDSYDSYRSNSKTVDSFYDFCEKESQAFYDRTIERAEDYFKLVSKSINLDDYEEWDTAISDFYEEWDRTFDVYYEAWDEIYEEGYEQFDTLISAGYENHDYQEYSDTWSSMYEKYSGSWGDMYESYSKSWGDIYTMYSEVWSGFYSGEADVDKILKEAEAKKEKAEAEEKEESEKKKESSQESKPDEKEEPKKKEKGSGEDIDPEFKEAMDSYEAFFDEYIEFMKKYNKADSTTQLSLISDYTKFMTQYSETMQEMNDVDINNLNNAEQDYYLEVTTRISTKLMQAASEISGQ